MGEDNSRRLDGQSSRIPIRIREDSCSFVGCFDTLLLKWKFCAVRKLLLDSVPHGVYRCGFHVEAAGDVPHVLSIEEAEDILLVHHRQRLRGLAQESVGLVDVYPSDAKLVGEEAERGVARCFPIRRRGPPRRASAPAAFGGR